MQSAGEFLQELRGWYFRDYCDENQLRIIAARDSEWESMVDAERKAHEEIARTCFNAGASSGDGTSVSAVRSLVDRMDSLTEALKEIEAAGRRFIQNEAALALSRIARDALGRG